MQYDTTGLCNSQWHVVLQVTTVKSLFNGSGEMAFLHEIEVFTKWGLCKDYIIELFDSYKTYCIQL
jgi:hypothetical protein